MGTDRRLHRAIDMHVAIDEDGELSTAELRVFWVNAQHPSIEIKVDKGRSRVLTFKLGIELRFIPKILDQRDCVVHGVVTSWVLSILFEAEGELFAYR